jgi:hypothetical protein
MLRTVVQAVMTTLRATPNFAGWCIFAACGLLLPAIVLAAGPAKPQTPQKHAAAELLLEGKPVEKLTLTNEQGQSQEILHPGRSVSLPPGRYWIREIRVHWDANGPPQTDRDVNRLTLVPSGSCRLNVGSPRTPLLTAKHRGNLLMLNYNPRPNGEASRNAQFTIYQGDRKIASGSFEYG